MPHDKKKTSPRWTASPVYSVAFLLIFIFAFFPDLFIGAIGLPLYLIRPRSSNSQTASSTTGYSCTCRTDCAGFTPLPLPDNPQPAMSWFQKTISLQSRSRGSYLITDEITAALPELKSYKVGILHLFVQHTSCALSMNENWDSDVREDMTDAMERIVPYDKKGNLYRHSAEGEDDMPAHIKSALIGSSVTIPISNGKLATGTWQGIWYLEFRAMKHSRKIVATVQGERA